MRMNDRVYYIKAYNLCMNEFVTKTLDYLTKTYLIWAQSNPY